jgi:subtilase family serine protease
MPPYAPEGSSRAAGTFKGEIVIRRLSAFLLTVVALASGVNVVCQAQSQTLLTRHVREVILNGQAPLVGKLPATQSMRFDIVLALRHQPELENFLQELYDPSSSDYRHFVTVPEFTERFGPSQEDYNAVISFAKANGFTVVGASRDAFDVQLKGTAASVEKAFHVTLSVYQHPTENRTFYAPDREPTVDLPFQLWHITGLDNYSVPRPALLRRAASQAKSEATTGSCPQQSFCGSDMRAAYYEGTTLTGAGQNIGLLEYAGFDIADVNTYYKNAGQTRTAAVTGISADGSSVNCTEAGGCDDTEQTLDITQALGMAPGVTTLYVYVSDSSDTALLSSMSTHSPLPLSLSSSWTWSPADPSTDDPYFEKMAAQGQSFFQASGDDGSYTGSAPWPSNSAYVVAVGGTDLETQGAGGPWKSESAWSDGGGGWGTNVLIPSWQQLPGVITKANGGSTTYRNVPDVAANANFTFYVCADQDGCTANDYGGTSFAAPMWAGYLALANQQASANGVPAPGFIDPTIYPLNLSNGDADFHDITSGSNGLSCVTGYNLCAGWGSPNGSGLIEALTGPTGSTYSLTATPNSLSISQSSSGTSTITVVPQDGFSGSVTLSASGLPTGVTSGFSKNPTSSTSTLTLKANASAATGTSTVTISGVSGSLTQTTTLSLTVTAAAGNPVVTLSVTSLAWGNVVEGATSAAKPVTVTNTGTGTLNIGGIAISGDFAQTTSSKPCGSTLAAGKNCIIKVTFTPTQVGERTGTLTLTDNASNSPQTVALSGTGAVQAKLTPAAATFPAEKVGTSSPAKVFTLHNEQSIALKSIAISTTGDFSVSTKTCTTSLAAKADCTISVVLTPTAKGTRTGTLTVADSAAGSPQTASLTGTGK